MGCQHASVRALEATLKPSKNEIKSSPIPSNSSLDSHKKSLRKSEKSSKRSLGLSKGEERLISELRDHSKQNRIILQKIADLLESERRENMKFEKNTRDTPEQKMAIHHSKETKRKIFSLSSTNQIDNPEIADSPFRSKSIIHTRTFTIGSAEWNRLTDQNNTNKNLSRAQTLTRPSRFAEQGKFNKETICGEKESLNSGIYRSKAILGSSILPKRTKFNMSMISQASKQQHAKKRSTVNAGKRLMPMIMVSHFANEPSLNFGRRDMESKNRVCVRGLNPLHQKAQRDFLENQIPNLEHKSSFLFRPKEKFSSMLAQNFLKSPCQENIQNPNVLNQSEIMQLNRSILNHDLLTSSSSESSDDSED